MTKETFTLDGTEYTWYNYTEPIFVLNASDVNNIQSNFETIKALLALKGITISELSKEVARVNTQYVKVVDILNSIEYNLDIVNNEGIKSPYYGESYRAYAGGLAHNREQIWRWVQFLNDVLPIAKGEKGNWSYLLCSDGYPTIKSKRFLVRGDLIG